MAFTIPHSRPTIIRIPVTIITKIIDKIRITYGWKCVFACVVFIIRVFGFIIVKIVIYVNIRIALWTIRCEDVTTKATKTMRIGISYAHRLSEGSKSCYNPIVFRSRFFFHFTSQSCTVVQENLCAGKSCTIENKSWFRTRKPHD